MSALFNTPEDDSVQEEVGESRLGGDNVMANYGFTLFVISALFAGIILIVVIATFIIKKTGYQGKVKTRVEQFKKRLFYNILIEYVLLNSLKYFIMAFTAFRLKGSDIGSITIAVIILLLYLVLSVLFTCLLHMRELQLGDPEQKEKIGKLYEGMTTLDAINILSKRPLTWLYSALFLGRRCLFAV